MGVLRVAIWLFDLLGCSAYGILLVLLFYFNVLLLGLELCLLVYVLMFWFCIWFEAAYFVAIGVS